MPVSAATLSLLMEKGLYGADLLEVVRAIDEDNAPKKRSAGAIRQARYREKLASDEASKKKSDVTDDVTSDASLDASVPPKSNINPPQNSLRSVSVSARKGWFDEFWTTYPKRKGSNPRQPAEEKFYRLLKASPIPEVLAREIIAGAEAYAASVVNDDPRFTKQTVTWLNQGCWKDDHTAPEIIPFERGAPHIRLPDKIIDTTTNAADRIIAKLQRSG